MSRHGSIWYPFRPLHFRFPAAGLPGPLAIRLSHILTFARTAMIPATPLGRGGGAQFEVTNAASPAAEA
jgi:hypothetical protein